MQIKIRCPKCGEEIWIERAQKRESDLGRKILQYRYDHGYTQDQLAKRWDVNRHQIVRWENGMNIPNAKMTKLIHDKLK